MQTDIGFKTKSNCLSSHYHLFASCIYYDSSLRSSAELTARLLRTIITKLDILESDMIMRTVAAGLPDTP